MFARVRIDIQAPPATVFAILRDPEKRKGWMAGLMSTKQTSGKPGAVDSTFTDIILEGDQKKREYQGTILANEFPTRLMMQLQTPKLTVINEWTLVQQPSGTRLTCAAKTRNTGWLLKLLSPFAQRVMKRIVKKQAKRIKMLAESRDQS
jgi:uncharacterized protein YndB with AHSA1/START domain